MHSFNKIKNKKFMWSIKKFHTFFHCVKINDSYNRIICWIKYYVRRVLRRNTKFRLTLIFPQEFKLIRELTSNHEIDVKFVVEIFTAMILRGWSIILLIIKKNKRIYFFSSKKSLIFFNVCKEFEAMKNNLKNRTRWGGWKIDSKICNSWKISLGNVQF